MGLHLQWHKAKRVVLNKGEKDIVMLCEVKQGIERNYFFRSQKCSRRFNHVVCPFAKDENQKISHDIYPEG